MSIPIEYDNIPHELISKHNWVVWGVDGAGGVKVPYSPNSVIVGRPTPAKAGRNDTWGRYEQAIYCVQAGLAKGIGYEFDGTGLWGVDIDKIITDNAMRDAMAIIDVFGSYAEWSPSGKGIHILVAADNVDIERHRSIDSNVEIYGKGRYFTVTGDAVNGVVMPIAMRSEELQWLHDTLLLPKQDLFQSAKPQYSRVPPAVCADNGKYLHIGLKHDKRFADLWAGHRPNGNESSDDFGLCVKLAYWCNLNEADMLASFFNSNHYAQKTPEQKKKWERGDYSRNTISKAASALAKQSGVTAADKNAAYLNNFVRNHYNSYYGAR